MKIKDLPKDKPLGGVVFLHPETGERCIWASQWQKGVWFKKDAESDHVFPISVEKLEDALDFEVTQ
jgi:hypothetical protein